MERPIFASVREYGRCFIDAAFWQPYVAEVCRRHGLAPVDQIRAGLPGSHPVFLVGDRWVVKLFSDLFSGEESFAIEREIYALLQPMPEFPVPRQVAEGDLFTPEGGWRWPYLVSTCLPGASLGEVWDAVRPADRQAIARYMGRWLKALHTVPLASATVLRPDWEPFAAWLAGQRAACVESHRRWGSLPARLLKQLDDFLPPAGAHHPLRGYPDRASRPLLLHGDMNTDHLLGDFREGHWVPSGIIDFGDAKVGDLHYELVALHLGLFRGEKRLLRLFFDAYGPDIPARRDFPTLAMAFTLLHEFDVLGETLERIPELRQVPTLTELADRLWDLE